MSKNYLVFFLEKIELVVFLNLLFIFKEVFGYV
jgi:hypothetical protein